MQIQNRLADKNSFSFIVLGDSNGKESRFVKVIRKAAVHQPDFIIQTGDFTRKGDIREYTAFSEITRNGHVPFLFAAGNHDIVKSKGLKNYRKFFGPFDFFFDAGRYRFIFVNNNNRRIVSEFKNITEQPGFEDTHEFVSGMDNHQISTLQNLLHEKRSSFIIMHQPPPVGPFMHHSFTRNADTFLRTVEQYSDSVLAVLCGHIHGYCRYSYKGVPIIVSGGAGARLHTEAEGIVSKNNYVHITVDEGILKSQVYFL